MATVAQDETMVAQISGRYLYAIIDVADAPRAFGFAGIDGADVYTIADGNVAAVVSDMPVQKVRPERRRLAAHHEVLRRLMDDHAVLPMVFGLIASSPEAVDRILRLNREAFDERLQKVQGRVEMGLRVTWDVPNIFEYALTVHPELGTLRDHIFRGGREPSQDEKIELGRLFDRLLTADREEHTERVTQMLGAHCDDVVANKPRNEREVMNLACLVDRTQLKSFELGIASVARLFDEHFSFDYNGPWPPHNFVDIDLQMP